MTSVSKELLLQTKALGLQRSKHLLREGLALMSRALQQNKAEELLLRACKCFHLGIKSCPDYVENYLSLSRAFFLLADSQKAYNYALKAYAVSPDSPEVRNLVTLLQAEIPVNNIGGSDSLKSENEIQEYLFQAEQTNLLLESEQLAVLDQIQSQILAQLHKLEDTESTHQLHVAADKVSQRLMQLNQREKWLKKQASLQAKIVALQGVIRKTMRQPVSSKMRYQNLEYLLDQCDLMGVELSYLLQQKIDTLSVEREYDILVMLLTRFQDAIDEAP